MNYPDSGELPLHPPPSPLPLHTSLTYADYWRSLSTSSPSPPLGAVGARSGTVHAAALHSEKFVSHRREKSTDISTAAATATTTTANAVDGSPHRVIHAATNAYRLQLSLSPHSTDAPMRTPLFNKGTSSPSHAGSAKMRAPPVSAATVAAAAAGMADYAVDTHVLRAVRCYEEWRHCLCSEGTAEKPIAEVSAPESGLTLDTAADKEAPTAAKARVEGGVGEKAMASEGLARSSLPPPPSAARTSGEYTSKTITAHANSPLHQQHHHTTHAGSGSREHPKLLHSSSFNASPPQPAVDRSGSQHSISSSNRSTHGLTNARGAREASAGSRVTSVSCRVPSPVVVVVGAAAAVPSTDTLSPSPMPTTHAEAAESPLSLSRRGGAPSSTTGPVQRQLFADEEEDEEYMNGGVTPTAALVRLQEMPDRGIEVNRLRTRGILGPRLAFNASFPHLHRATPAANPALIETVIELSCSSSSDESVCGDDAIESEVEKMRTSSLPSSGTATAEAGEDASPPPRPPSVWPVHPQKDVAITEGPKQAADAIVLSHRDPCWDVPGACSEATILNSAASSSSPASALQHHPLYIKHHAVVAHTYATRLLESERQNDEVQLFLCWAQERAERRRHRWQLQPPQPSGPSPVACTPQPSLADSGASSDLVDVMEKTLSCSSAAQNVLRGAYMPFRGPQLQEKHSWCSPSSSSPSVVRQRHTRPAVYVAPPLGVVVDVTKRPTTAAAAAAAASETSPFDDTATWMLTPSSPNSRFIAWVADDVDVYEGLLP